MVKREIKVVSLQKNNSYESSIVVLNDTYAIAG